MPRFLVRFAQFHVQFRLPELMSLAKLHDIKVEFDPLEYSDNCAFLVIVLDNVEAAVKLVSRSILIKDIIELWAIGDTFDALVDNIKSGTQWLRPEYKTCSFKFMVHSSGISLSMAKQISKINKFAWLKYDGPIVLTKPDATFTYYEDFGFNASLGTPTPDEPVRMYFGLWISSANRSIVAQYDLKKRGYLGTTSMDAELSLVMANQALARPGSFTLDPFVGTGSFLVSCSHFGAYTVGSDIDGRQIRGSGDKSVETNIGQYGLQKRVIGSLICDIVWIFEGPVKLTPPYGVRAGAKKIANSADRSEGNAWREGSNFKENGEPRYPLTVAYQMEDVVVDLVAFAAAYLVPGGRLVFWLPTLNEQYEPQDIPTHPSLVLVSNSEQSFGKWSRRLITMEKIIGAVDSSDDLVSARREVVAGEGSSKELGHARFRDKYFGDI
ncbi:hypothetical protein BSLG_008721 [Batrachochytrium salamandrivorans]|nr:hypothetical protein BSLG_008721 [Batrachochytrium salamandrivorans]